MKKTLHILFFSLIVPTLGHELLAQDKTDEKAADEQRTYERLNDQTDVPRGWYSGLITGKWFFLNRDDRSLYGDGWLVGVKFGYDILKYLAIEAQYKASAHNNAPKGAAENPIPETYWGHQLQLMVRGCLPVTKRWTFSLDGGGGIWYSRPNIKPNISEPSRYMASFGLGVQYFTRVRGTVIGIDPAISFLGDMKGPAVQATGYLRYTF